VFLSNSYMLERCFGFRGLLIEANPTSFAKLHGGPRAALGHSTLVHSAVCSGSGLDDDGVATSVRFAVGSGHRKVGTTYAAHPRPPHATPQLSPSTYPKLCSTSYPHTSSTHTRPTRLQPLVRSSSLYTPSTSLALRSDPRAPAWQVGDAMTAAVDTMSDSFRRKHYERAGSSTSTSAHRAAALQTVDVPCRSLATLMKGAGMMQTMSERTPTLTDRLPERMLERLPLTPPHEYTRAHARRPPRR
jgi:hypothetical protein